MSTGDVLGVVGVVVGVVAILVSIHYARKADRTEMMRRRLSWSDLQAAANDLSRKIRHDGSPVVVLTPGLSGATFANILVTDFENQPPVYVGTRTWLTEDHRAVADTGSWIFETKKWLISIPKVVLEYKDGPILIVDDFAMSGDFLEVLRAALVDAGVAPDRIRTATIAVTNVSVRNHKAPDYYWWTAEDDDFYFPWGKAR